MSYKKLSNYLLELTLRCPSSHENKKTHPFYFNIQINDTTTSYCAQSSNLQLFDRPETSATGWTVEFAQYRDGVTGATGVNLYSYSDGNCNSIQFGPYQCQSKTISESTLQLDMACLLDTNYEYDIINWGTYTQLLINPPKILGCLGCSGPIGPSLKITLNDLTDEATTFISFELSQPTCEPLLLSLPLPNQNLSPCAIKITYGNYGFTTYGAYALSGGSAFYGTTYCPANLQWSVSINSTIFSSCYKYNSDLGTTQQQVVYIGPTYEAFLDPYTCLQNTFNFNSFGVCYTVDFSLIGSTSQCI